MNVLHIFSRYFNHKSESTIQCNAQISQYNLDFDISVFEGPQLPEGFVPQKSSDGDGENEGTSGDTEKQEEWYEAMSDMGYPYYWNTITGGRLDINFW